MCEKRNIQNVTTDQWKMSFFRDGWTQNQKIEAKAKVQQVTAMSSAFMWTSMNMDVDHPCSCQ